MGALYLRQKVYREKNTGLNADSSGDSQREKE